MVTRSKNGISKRKILVSNISDIESLSVVDALLHDRWKKAMNDEYEALIRNNTWTLVEPPSDRKIVGCKWVFKVKENPDGSISRYKARLIAKGYHQRPGFAFHETFSPVVKPTTIRVVITLALSLGWFIR